MKTKRLNYKEQLETKEWAFKRFTIFKRDNYTCCNCKSKENLQVHHLFYIKGKYAWEVPNNYLKTLCATCHKKEHELTSISKFIKKTKNKKRTSHKDKIKNLKESLSGRDKYLQERYDKIKK